ncbi:MAG: DUF1987 domain-containing protein [Bacteroidales bacterium]|nr:DUF1987 domain-containing protein [Bacteroidales bacterium]
MHDLVLEPTQYTPAVSFLAEGKVFTMAGECYPPDVESFFVPIIDWLKGFSANYLKNKKENGLTINFKFEYLNTSSMKYMVEVLLLLKKLVDHGSLVTINWYCLPEDEQMPEDGTDLSFAVDLPFYLIAME